MQNSKNKLITTITLIVIAFLMLPILAFGLGTNKGVNTAWSVSPYLKDGTNSYMADSVILSVDGSAKSVAFYIGNVYNAPNGKITIVFDPVNSENDAKDDSYLITSRQEFTFEANTGDYLGWVSVEFKNLISAKYFKFSTEQSFELFEIAVIDKDKNLIPISCYGGIVWTDKGHTFVDAKKDANSFSLVADEQDGIATKKGINSLTKEETQLSGAIDNFINFKSGFVSDAISPLGVELSSIGVLIFGNGPFGLRIVGFLFFVATLYLLFFLARKIFGSIGYSILTVALYLISGLGLSLVINSSPITYAIFFVLLAFWFALKFNGKAKDGKGLRTNIHNLVLCGLFFALALCVWLFSLFILPALLTLILLPAIKVLKSTYEVYKNADGLEKELAREKHTKTLRGLVLYGVMGFAVMPILLIALTYGIAFPTYANYFNKGFLGAIFANHARIFASQAGSNLFAWLIGLGSYSSTNAFGVQSFIFANRALTVVCILSFLLIGALYLLNSKNRILSGNIIVNLKEQKGNIFAILLAFASAFIFNIIFWGKNSYLNFAIPSVFAILGCVTACKLVNSQFKRHIFRFISVAIVTVVVLFFLLQTPFIFKFDLPKDLMVIYNWLA